MSKAIIFLVFTIVIVILSGCLTQNYYQSSEGFEKLALSKVVFREVSNNRAVVEMDFQNISDENFQIKEGFIKFYKNGNYCAPTITAMAFGKKIIKAECIASVGECSELLLETYEYGFTDENVSLNLLKGIDLNKNTIAHINSYITGQDCGRVAGENVDYEVEFTLIKEDETVKDKGRVFGIWAIGKAYRTE